MLIVALHKRITIKLNKNPEIKIMIPTKKFLFLFAERLFTANFFSIPVVSFSKGQIIVSSLL